MTDHPISNSYWVVPGRLLAGEYPSEWRDAAARRRLGALLDAGIRSFLDLTETEDSLTPYDSLLRTLANERGVGVAYRRMAIPDGGTPTNEHMRAVLAHIESEMKAERAVYVHCLGGIGRTGTVAGCWMVEKQGRTALQALDRIAELRKDTPTGYTHSPETHEQREFIVRWACALAGRSALSLADRCDALLKFAPHFDGSDTFATLVSPLIGDGMAVPYCQLAPWAADFVQTLEDAGWCIDCNWQAFQDEGQRYVEDPSLVATADVDVLAKLLTVHVHLDRLNDGHLADMADRGHLKAILGRLRELRNQHVGA